MNRYRLADATHRVPMPERGPGVFFTAEATGESIDPMSPYYARMIADGDLLQTDPEIETPAAPSAKKER